MKLSRLHATAYHEAGHAVARFLLGLPFKNVTVIPTEDYLGHVKPYSLPKSFKPDIDLGNLKIRLRLEKEIMASLAGHAAERRFSGRRNFSGSDHDYRYVVDLAMYVGGSSKQTETFMKWMQIRTDEWVDSQGFQRAVKVVADELVKKKQLSCEEVRNILCEHWMEERQENTNDSFGEQ